MEDEVASHQMGSSTIHDSSHLAKQDLETLDVSKLTPTTPEVMSRQATLNCGTIGHVAHGKSTVVRSLSGVKTVRFKSEVRRNITIKLGYANAKIYKCDGEKHEAPACYTSRGSSASDTFPCDREGCGGTYQLVRHVSFVDCFGPDAVFATPTGAVRNADIARGTELLGPDGRVRVVGAVEDGVKRMFRVDVAGAEPFTASGGHLLCLRIDAPVEPPMLDADKAAYVVRHYMVTEQGLSASLLTFADEREALRYHAAADKAPVYFEMPVESFLAAPSSLRDKARMYVPAPMHFDDPAVDLAFGDAAEEDVAWLVGAWLVRGDASAPRLTLPAASPEAVKRARGVAKGLGLACSVDPQPENDGAAVALEGDEESAFWRTLVQLGVDGNKHVPRALLRHTPEVRAAAVAGAMDAAGSRGCELELADSEVFDGVVRLARSVGYFAQCSSRQTKRRARFVQESSVAFTVSDIGEAPFRKWEVDGDGKVLLESFVVAHNCPGHDILMATMLNGAAVMDAAMLLVAGNEPCPQPQTSEHLAAIEIMGLKHILILQNKIDLVKEAAAKEQYNQIEDFVVGTNAAGAPVIPISAQLKYNIDVVCEYLCTKIPLPVRDFTSAPRLIIIRSFDINRPGTAIDKLQGGVAGGTITQGVLKVGDKIEIRPGRVLRGKGGAPRCVPIVTTVVSLFAERNSLQYAVPGGLIGVGTGMDPQLCRGDRLVGHVLGTLGTLPPVFAALEINFFLLRRLLGLRTENGKLARVSRLAPGETLMVNIGSTSTGGRVTDVNEDLAKISLYHPVCTAVGEKVALSRRVESHWRLIGWSRILRGVEANVASADADEAADAGESDDDNDSDDVDDDENDQ